MAAAGRDGDPLVPNEGWHAHVRVGMEGLRAGIMPTRTWACHPEHRDVLCASQGIAALREGRSPERLVSALGISSRGRIIDGIHHPEPLEGRSANSTGITTP